MQPSIDFNSIDASSVKVKDLVLADFHTAKVLEKFGIDYCCKGNQILKDALNARNIPESVLKKEINTLIKTGKNENEVNYENWDLNILAQYIIETHHSYVKNAIPQIGEHLAKVVNKHSVKHPFLAQINEAFISIANELVSHMMKEEKILFPLIKYLSECKKFEERPKSGGYGSIKNPIRQMELEHVAAGDLMGEIRTLSNNYELPQDACTTFKLTYDELQEFEKDLFKHVHLENNILFPKVIELEEELIKNY
jgi:regulator of cell morphogenesis and NO signaling